MWYIATVFNHNDAEIVKKHLPLLFVPSLLLMTGAGCASSSNYSAQTNTTTTPPSTQGKAVITVTDDAPSLAGVTAVVLTVDKVEVHSATAGWVTVSSVTQQYDLLKLKGTKVSQLLANAAIDAGTYDSIRLTVSNVSVTTNGKTETAKLPSHTLSIVGKMTVVAGQTSTASLDFDLAKSLHLTGKGMFILAPVVKLQTKHNVEVKIKEDDSVETSGGDVETDSSQGMDVNGDMKANFELPDKLNVDTNDMINVETKGMIDVETK